MTPSQKSRLRVAVDALVDAMLELRGSQAVNVRCYVALALIPDGELPELRCTIERIARRYTGDVLDLQSPMELAAELRQAFET